MGLCRLIAEDVVRPVHPGGVDGAPLWNEKARVLGDSLVNKQQANGGIETYWYESGMRFNDSCDEIDWLDCMMDDAEALLDLACVECPNRRPE